MGKILTGLELKVIIKELQNIVIGARLNKVYQPDPKILLLGFRKEGNKYTIKIDSGKGVYLTSYDYKTQEIPPSFCMFLRKYLMNAPLADIKQKDLERVIEFSFDTKEGKRTLICELFGKGNFILCDQDYVILNLAVGKVFKDRTLKKGEKYKHPPEKFNILKLNKKLFSGAMESWKDHSVVKMLASGLGIGGTYAEEVCLRSKVDKKKVCSQLNKDTIEEIYAEIQKLLLDFDKAKGGLIYLEENPIDASPLKLKRYSDVESKQVATFNESIDVLFASSEGGKAKEEKEAEFEKRLQKIQQRLDIQKRSLEEYKEAWQRNQRVADEIYERYQTISNILEKITSAKNLSYSWDDINLVLEQERSRHIEEAILIKKLIPTENKILVDIAGGIELNLNKSISENAAVYYDKAKVSKAKISGGEKIVSKLEKEVRDFLSKKDEIKTEIAKKIPKVVEVVKRAWYEKFYWFYTSSGLLAIGGRDASQNEMVIKKHLEVKDIVFHTEMSGSPFFILKEGKEKSTEKDQEEVAIATASLSRAWSAGASSIDVYWVKPEQVTKEAKAGEYLSKGAFMVRGKRNFLRGTVLQISIGVDKNGRVFSGPRSAVAKHAVKYVSISHGSEKKSDIAKKIVQQLGARSIDDVMRSMPGGTFSLVSI